MSMVFVLLLLASVSAKYLQDKNGNVILDSSGELRLSNLFFFSAFTSSTNFFLAKKKKKGATNAVHVSDDLILETENVNVGQQIGHVNSQTVVHAYDMKSTSDGVGSLDIVLSGATLSPSTRLVTGTAQFATLGQPSTLVPSSVFLNDFTVEATVTQNTASGSDTVFEHTGASAPFRIQFQRNSNCHDYGSTIPASSTFCVVFGFPDETGTYTEITGDMDVDLNNAFDELGEPHHIAVTFDSALGVASLFWDGVVVASYEAGQGYNAGYDEGQTTYLGAQGGSINFLDGSIANLAIHNSVLPSWAIADHAADKMEFVSSSSSPISRGVDAYLRSLSHRTALQMNGVASLVSSVDSSLSSHISTYNSHVTNYNTLNSAVSTLTNQLAANTFDCSAAATRVRFTPADTGAQTWGSISGRYWIGIPITLNVGWISSIGQQVVLQTRNGFWMKSALYSGDATRPTTLLSETHVQQPNLMVTPNGWMCQSLINNVYISSAGTYWLVGMQAVSGQGVLRLWDGGSNSVYFTDNSCSATNCPAPAGSVSWNTNTLYKSGMEAIYA